MHYYTYFLPVRASEQGNVIGSVSIYIYIQVKKKAFKINAKIEDVGLNERLKKYGNKKWSLNFHDQPKSQNPTYCFFFLSELRVSTALLIILQYLLALYQLLLHKKIYFYCYGLPHILLKI